VSIAQTALVFAGIPILVVGAFALLVFGPGEVRQPNRYRPGKPWTYPPVWYLPRPTTQPPSAGGGHAELTASARPAIESGSSASDEGPSAAPIPKAVGGASGEW
jgi:hypothetical protein